MGQSKKEITLEEMFEWLASAGYMFPSTPLELARFEKLYNDFDYNLSEECVDPFAIINGDYKPKKLKIEFAANIELSEDMKMAARNFKNIPEHILKKLKRNQNGLGSEEEGSEDKTD